jgi:hypothetical protein
MDTLTFIAEIVKALAWPVTAILIFLILRRPLLNLFPLVQRLRFQGIELDFSRQVHALAAEAHNQLPAPPVAHRKGQPLRAHWVELAQLSPRAVVLEAWLHVEKAAVQASQRHTLNLRSVELRSPLILGEALEEAGILQDGPAGIYHQLRNLRNAAAHASEFAFTPDSAIEYADLAARLTEFLQSA